MLSGVLVIAFPVSVFSDLFSQELKDSKEFEALFHDDIDDINSINNNNNSDKDTFKVNNGFNADTVLNGLLESGGDIRRSVRCNNNSVARSDSELQSLSNDPMYIVMEKDDLNDIVTSLHSIQHNQKRIQYILRKYYDYDK
jgi:hypothetical protein